jgi:hypothetical protein
MIPDEEKEGIVGNLTLFKDTVTETIGTDRKVIRDFRSER